MLQKVILIKNIGRFFHCAAGGDVTFRRFTLICAENGRGKTTLCAILRSLSTNSPAYIMGRKTLGSMDQPEVQLLFNSGNKVFRNRAWSDLFPDILIFDGTYVGENVFAGELVDTEHRRNLYRVIIGAAGVTSANRVNELDNQIRGKNNEIRDARARLQQYVQPGISFEAFVALPEDLEIDDKIAAKEKELQAVRLTAQLQERSGLAAITLPAFPASFVQLLAKTFATVAATAEQQVSDHIARHGMQSHGERWLNEGLRHVTHEECPFCGQSLTGIGLIQAYKNFFSTEYLSLAKEVTDLGNQINSTIGDRVASTIQQALINNKNSAEFWQQYCTFISPTLPAEEKVGEVLVELRRSAQALLQSKAGSPLEAIPLDERFESVLKALDSLRASIATYNAAALVANSVIDVKKRESELANPRDLESAIANLKAQKSRHTDEVKALCALERRMHQEKEALEKAKAEARAQLDAHTKQVISRYGDSINLYLERINAGFRITPPTHNYRGGAPNTSYQIVINQHAVELGDSGTPTERPSFRNTLSAGDRSALAFAFFLAQLESDGDKARKVVVVDDPFASLDGFRRNHTVQQLHKCGDPCAQVIVLSHEPAFLKLLWDRLPPTERKSLRLVRIGEGNTTIAEWEIERAARSGYHSDMNVLQEFFSLGKGEPRDVIQKLRPLLESFCHALCPTQLAEQDMMGDIVRKIRAAGAPHILHPIADDFEEVNIYCRRYHHGENIQTTTEPIDNEELLGYVTKTLKLVGCIV
jgi:wobble nucleotide-excising tRNase